MLTSPGPVHEVDIGATVDAARIRPLHVSVFILCFLVSMLDGFDIQTLAFAAASIRSELSIPPDLLGFVFSGTLLGAVAGAYFGALADRIGRKSPTIVAVALFGSMTLACAFAQDFWTLLLFRFVAGIGLGGAVPNMIALTSEYAPRRIRSLAVTAVLWGFPLGAVFGGMVSAWLIGAFGWRAIFVFGAAGPLVLVPVMLMFLPESIRFLALARPGDPALVRLLASVDPMVVIRPGSRIYLAEARAVRGSLSDLFRGGLAWGSVLLAGACFSSLLLSYLMTSWTPLLLESGGTSKAQAIWGSIVINIGSLVGSYALSRVEPGGHVVRPIAVCFGLGALSVLGAAFAGASDAWVFILLGAFGCFHIGAQIAITNYTAEYYPTALRGTGIAWVGAVGRMGSLLGPLLGGALLSTGFPMRAVFATGAVAGVVTALLIALLASRTPSRRDP